MISARGRAQKPSIMAEKNLGFGEGRFLQKNLGFGVGFGYRNNTTRWKTRVEFLLSVIELLFLSLVAEVLQGKTCQNSLPSGVGRSLGANISGGSGRPPANILIPLERQLIALQLCS